MQALLIAEQNSNYIRLKISHNVLAKIQYNKPRQNCQGLLY